MSDGTTNAERLNLLRNELSDLIQVYGDDPATWPEGQRTLADRITRGIKRMTLGAEVEASRAARSEHVRSVMRSGNFTTDNGFGGAVHPEIEALSRRQNAGRPWQGLGTDVGRADSPRAARAFSTRWNASDS